MGLTRAELESFAGRTIPDLEPDTLRLLFVGTNPSLTSAATGHHFARRGNRFYPALAAAGILPADAVDPAAGSEVLRRLGVGITNLVARASVRADELDDEELRAGRTRLEAYVADRRPAVVAVAGISAYRIAFGRRAARPGRQEQSLAGSELWIVPNPSGLNAHETVGSLAVAYGLAADAAGISRARRADDAGRREGSTGPASRP